MRRAQRRAVGPELRALVVETQRRQMLRGINDLETEGFRRVYRLTSVEELKAATVVQGPL